MLLSNRNHVLLISILFISIGIFLRLHQLNFENYWLDEMLSFWVADPNISLDATFARSEHIDQAPPLFNLFLKKYLGLFGYEPEIGRHVPLFFGLLSIPFLGILSHQVAKNNSFLLTILLISINIYLIKYSQESRPYALVFLLSSINLILYYKIISPNLVTFKQIYFFLLFVIFSILSLSSHPFVLIVFFSQIAHSIYSFLIFKKKNLLFFLSIPLIMIIYLLINYNYLNSQLAYNEYFLAHENWKFYYNYYFSRFFGSKIIGLIYFSVLIFLIIRFRKKILFTPNNYLPLIFVLFFSYIIPLFYGLFKFPILTDRYIIFVLIPVLILISSLIYEINNRKIRIFILMITLIPTIINNYIEIQFRKNTKPEFTKLLNNLSKHEINILTLYGEKRELKLVENYIKTLKEFKNKNFTLFNINNPPSDTKMFWVICYEPIVGYNCTIPNDKKKEWNLISTKNTYLLDSKLFKIDL